MKRRDVVRLIAAKIDVIEAAENIGRNNPEAAIRFSRAVRATEELLLAAPGMVRSAITAIRL